MLCRAVLGVLRRFSADPVPRRSLLYICVASFWFLLFGCTFAAKGNRRTHVVVKPVRFYRERDANVCSICSSSVTFSCSLSLSLSVCLSFSPRALNAGCRTRCTSFAPSTSPRT